MSDAPSRTYHDMTLTEVLREFGWTHRPAHNNAMTGLRDVVDRDGDAIFTGSAWQTWEWLSRTVGLPSLDQKHACSANASLGETK